MVNVLGKMIGQLSDIDRTIFGQLAAKLKEVNGDISKLSKEDYKVIAEMETKYASQFESYQGAPTEQADLKEKKVGKLLETGFAAHARQVLARDLKDQFPKEEDAVKFAFQNKWIPQDFKDPKIVTQLFDDYKQDICEANEWREELVGVQSDKGLAIGLTWFMVVFQLNERLN